MQRTMSKKRRTRQRPTRSGGREIDEDERPRFVNLRHFLTQASYPHRSQVLVQTFAAASSRARSDASPVRRQQNWGTNGAPAAFQLLPAWQPRPLADHRRPCLEAAFMPTSRTRIQCISDHGGHSNACGRLCAFPLVLGPGHGRSTGALVVSPQNSDRARVRSSDTVVLSSDQH